MGTWCFDILFSCCAYPKVTPELTNLLECFPLSDSSSFHDVWMAKKSTVRLMCKQQYSWIKKTHRTPEIPYCSNLTMYVVLYVCIPFTLGCWWLEMRSVEILDSGMQTTPWRCTIGEILDRSGCFCGAKPPHRRINLDREGLIAA